MTAGSLGLTTGTLVKIFPSTLDTTHHKPVLIGIILEKVLNSHSNFSKNLFDVLINERVYAVHENNLEEIQTGEKQD
jgi:hypothetical protein